MKCISLWQPWASLIAIGAKRIETRSWSTKYRGPLAIHAAQHYSMQTAAFANRAPCSTALQRCCLAWGSLPRGAIVATCQLVDVAETRRMSPYLMDDNERAFGDFSAGRFAWILRDIVPLPEPLPFKGARGLFEVPLTP